MEKISGKIENVVYHNDVNEYTVFELVSDDNQLIVSVGTMPMAFEGERVVLHGEFTFHKEFGEQFAFTRFEKSLPDDASGILQYLSSSTVKGVGPATALKIVNKFGKDTFDVIENHPDWLTDIPGITAKRAAAIAESFREQNGMREVMLFCGEHIGVGEVSRVYKRYGTESVGIVKANPYILCEGSFGISFEKADKFAISLGTALDDENRVLSGMRYTLIHNGVMSGHTCIPREQMTEQAANLLCVDRSVIEKYLDSFINSGRLFLDKKGGAEYIMTPEAFSAENYIAAKLFEISRSQSRLSTENIAALVEKAEFDFGVSYAELQRAAIFKALDGGIMVLTGGPGTGKTTVVRALISIFKSIGLKTVLAAPTGRAAKRMSEATGEEAKTIHRMLEMERSMVGEIRFGKNEKYPLTENAVIIDEASMIDLSLMEALMRAVRRDTRLIFIGDSDQLPSVGAGNILSDLIESERISTVRLTEIFRQSKESLIVVNAHKINAGEAPLLTATDSDFFFVGRPEADISRTVADLITTRLPKAYGRDITEKIQVITPSKKGYGGVDTLNAELQNRLNPKRQSTPEKSAHGFVFREGDKVMQTVNNYDIEWEKGRVTGAGVFNGDIGVITEINLKKEYLTVRFDDGRVAEYEFSMLDDLDLAYAITVHKSQGSEYPVVIIPMYYCAPMLMTRNLLYTAITRARKMVILVGRADIAGKMAKNGRVIERYTTLAERIRDYF